MAPPPKEVEEDSDDEEMSEDEDEESSGEEVTVMGLMAAWPEIGETGAHPCVWVLNVL